MGLFNVSAPAALHPINPPLGVFGHFCVQQPTTLVLKEKAFSFSGVSNSFQKLPHQLKIGRLRSQGPEWGAGRQMQGEGHVVHRPQRCVPMAMLQLTLVITDTQGRVLFHLKNKLMAIHKTYIAEDDSGNEIFRVTKKMSCESLCVL